MSGRCCCLVGNGKLGARKSLRVMTRRKTFFLLERETIGFFSGWRRKQFCWQIPRAPLLFPLLPLLPLCSLIQWHGRRGGEWKGSGTQGRMDLGKQRMWGSFPPLTHTHKGEAPSSLAPSSATLQLPPPPHMHTTERGGKRHASVHAMPPSLSLVKGRNWRGGFANPLFLWRIKGEVAANFSARQ